MTPLALARAADTLLAARRAGVPVAELPADCIPADVDQGFRIQAEIARRSGGTLGWKVGGLTPEQRAKAGVTRPIGARLPQGTVLASPARAKASNYVKPLIECELAFRLGRDLPARGMPYSSADVADAIEAMHPAIEIADSRVPAGTSTALFLADGMGNGGFVYGAPITDWRGVDRGAAAVQLRINGNPIASGNGALVLGDPFLAVVILANHPLPGSDGLARGAFVTTGSLTGVAPVAGGDEVVADFGPLGQVEVRFQR
jgi:2-keto-4-pentenoate hydratase